MHARRFTTIGLSLLALSAGLVVSASASTSTQEKPPSGKPVQGKEGKGDKGKAAAAPAPPSNVRHAAGGYGIDPVHSTVLFKVKHANTSFAFGRFDNVSGTFTLLPENMERSMINVTIDTTSIDTNDKKRDAHLKSDAFFDVEQFPDATFVSRSIKKTGDTKYTAEGNLEIHGVKKPLSIELEETGAIDDPKLGVLAGFFAQFTVKRSDFGMNFMPAMLGDEVQVTVSIEGKQTDAK
jgi:polyisoprenoid-binding protein YceI